MGVARDRLHNHLGMCHDMAICFKFECQLSIQGWILSLRELSIEGWAPTSDIDALPFETVAIIQTTDKQLTDMADCSPPCHFLYGHNYFLYYLILDFWEFLWILMYNW